MQRHLFVMLLLKTVEFGITCVSRVAFQREQTLAAPGNVYRFYVFIGSPFVLSISIRKSKFAMRNTPLTVVLYRCIYIWRWIGRRAISKSTPVKRRIYATDCLLFSYFASVFSWPRRLRFLGVSWMLFVLIGEFEIWLPPNITNIF